MFPSAIDLRHNPNLRLLRFDLHLGKEEIKESQDNVIRWFRSICENITSRSLVVMVEGFSKVSKTCNEIQDILLSLYARIETFSVYLSEDDWEGDEITEKKDLQTLFPRLYEAGVVIKKGVRYSNNGIVGHDILIFSLPRSSLL